MAEIRHIAIVSADVDRSADFYQRAFDMVLLERGETPRAKFAYLSDGELNLAVLHYISDDMAGIRDSSKFVGAHHFGVQVDDLKSAQARAEQAGGRFHFNLGDEKKGNFESKYRDPNGVIFDISHGGWTGTPTQCVGERAHNAPPRGRPGVAMLRRFAIAVPEPERSARYFEILFGFRRNAGSALELSDGYVTMHIRRTENSGEYVGAREIGFCVPDVAAARRHVIAAGGASSVGRDTSSDPDGIPVTLAAQSRVQRPNHAGA